VRAAVYRCHVAGRGFRPGRHGGTPHPQIVLFLDCCYSGAFVSGMVVKDDGQVQVRDSFAELDAIRDDHG
jgi:hypothetical protein